MYLKSCWALFLLALVACQAAPSSLEAENSISEAKTFTKSDIELEDAGAEKDRAKKSATTFCVEVRSGKPEQVPCNRLEVRSQGLGQEPSKPLIITPNRHSVMFEPRHLQGQQLQLHEAQQSSQGLHLRHEQSPQFTNINVPLPSQPTQVVQSSPQVLPALTPVHHTPIINIVPSAPAPCDRPTIVQPSQPQIHTVHLIPQLPPQPQLPPHPKPPVQIKPPTKEEKPVPLSSFVPYKPPPLPLPRPKPKIAPYEQPALLQCPKCNNIETRPTGYILPRPTTYVDVNRPTDNYNNENIYECNCHKLENYVSNAGLRRPLMSSYPITEARAMMPSDATFKSMPYRSMMLSDPSIMLDEPVFFTSEGEAEERHNKVKTKYPDLNLNLHIPVKVPVLVSENTPTYYAAYPFYSPTTFTNYKISYGNEEIDYPNYDSSPAGIVNTGTLFVGGRESKHIDPSSQPSVEALRNEALSTTAEMMDYSINEKRESDNQLKKEQEEIAQKEKESQEPILLSDNN